MCFSTFWWNYSRNGLQNRKNPVRIFLVAKCRANITLQSKFVALFSYIDRVYVCVRMQEFYLCLFRLHSITIHFSLSLYLPLSFSRNLVLLLCFASLLGGFHRWSLLILLCRICYFLRHQSHYIVIMIIADICSSQCLMSFLWNNGAFYVVIYYTKYTLRIKVKARETEKLKVQKNKNTLTHIN